MGIEQFKKGAIEGIINAKSMVELIHCLHRNTEIIKDEYSKERYSEVIRDMKHKMDAVKKDDYNGILKTLREFGKFINKLKIDDSNSPSYLADSGFRVLKMVMSEKTVDKLRIFLISSDEQIKEYSKKLNSKKRAKFFEVIQETRKLFPDK